MSKPTFGTVKQVGAIVIAVLIVVAAGTVVGQAPMLFGADVADQPEAAIEFDDQESDGTSVTVASVTLSEGGFVVVTDDTEVVGASEYLPAGSHEEVVIEQRGDSDFRMLGHLTATVHQDLTDNESFVSPDEVEEDETHDRPYVEEGYPVSDSATVTMPEAATDGTTSSFVVEAVQAPENATTNETVEFVATVENPNEFETRQHVEFRLDGDLLERQILSLQGGERTERNFSVDLGEYDPGEYTYGVFTAEHGSIGELTVEHRPALTVREADAERVVANATLATEGYLAVSDENATIATSGNLSVGTHENATVDLGGAGVSAGQEVTVVLYADGDPDENATRVRLDGEPLEETVTLVEAGSDGEESGSDESGATGGESEARAERGG